jgi:hypothetical protein
VGVDEDGLGLGDGGDFLAYAQVLDDFVARLHRVAAQDEERRTARPVVSSQTPTTAAATAGVGHQAGLDFSGGKPVRRRS